MNKRPPHLEFNEFHISFHNLKQIFCSCSILCLDKYTKPSSDTNFVLLVKDHVETKLLLYKLATGHNIVKLPGLKPSMQCLLFEGKFVFSMYDNT